ncbi:type II toxin-antitoxin system HicA family toxin [Chromohalobacter nigrandesensis]|uniref:type II toxin-antitoxin system HicA family toxin n=1 Tax=Chromohalobacter nigrandesensis TaxID=119863 RepID=UPI001FF230EC|nr:type II toxin-antitoxin system HicA family toxin [Chromohalobacter nigrandesensis]MCK0743589.1 type II toxin-antitoxin system HicA family toxin [Chromohalobacter nigrandesensis]
MGNKRLDRLRQRPKDFTWDELVALLESLGYRLKNGKGSRRKFIDDQNQKISLHEPHPDNTMKMYLVDKVLTALEEHGKI